MGIEDSSVCNSCPAAQALLCEQDIWRDAPDSISKDMHLQDLGDAFVQLEKAAEDKDCQNKKNIHWLGPKAAPNPMPEVGSLRYLLYVARCPSFMRFVKLRNESIKERMQIEEN